MSETNRWTRFIDLVSSSKATRYTYKSALKKFFGNVYGLASEDIDLDEIAEQYFGEDRDYRGDVKQFYASIKSHPPKTVKTWLAAVKSFLMENGVEFKQRFWKRMSRRMKSTRPVTEDLVPSNAQLRRILSHMRARGKALYLLLASSGMRIGEALKIRLDDLHLEESPTRISIRGEYTKSGGRRNAFITDEATEALNEWLNIRKDKLETIIGRSKHSNLPNVKEAVKKSEEDDRIFPFSKQTAYKIWNNALDNARLNEIDERTNRHKMHVHTLRKFFRSRMGTVLKVDIVEALMGHEGYLTEVYRRYTAKQLGEKYREGEPAIAIFGAVGTSREFQKIKQEHAGLSSVIAELIEDKKTLQIENEELQKEVKGLQKRLTKAETVTDKVTELDGGVDTLTTFLNVFQGIKSPEDLYVAFTEWLGEEHGDRAFQRAFRLKGKQKR